MIGRPEDDFKNLSLDELKMLYRLYSDRLKSISKVIRERKKYKNNIDLDGSLNSDKIKQLSIDMLIKLGFNNINIYKEDAILISDKFYLDNNWNKTHTKYSNELLAAAIVTCILEYYDIKSESYFNRSTMEYKLVEIYDLSSDKFGELLVNVKDWTYNKYWIKN